MSGSEPGKDRRETEGHFASSVFDARSLSLQFVFCKTSYISVQKNKYLLKNPRCLSGTGWLFPTGGMSHWAQLDFHLVGVLGLSSAGQWRQLWDAGTDTPQPGHGCSAVPGEEGPVPGDGEYAAVGLGTGPTHPLGMRGSSVRAGGCPASPDRPASDVWGDFLRSLRGFRCTSCPAFFCVLLNLLDNPL